MKWQEDHSPKSWQQLSNGLFHFNSLTAEHYRIQCPGSELPTNRPDQMWITHLVQQLLQLLLQLHEVPGGDQAILGLVQAVSGKFHQLVLNKAQHTVGQGQGGVRGTLRYDVKQLTLHLGCCLGNKDDGYSYKAGDTGKKSPKDVPSLGKLRHVHTEKVRILHTRKLTFTGHPVKMCENQNIGEAQSTLHTFGKRSLYTWFIITTSLSNVPQLLPGLNKRSDVIQVWIEPETLKRWCSLCPKQSAPNQNAAFLHSKCLAECIYKLVSLETTALHFGSGFCLWYPWLHLLPAQDFVTRECL